MNNFRKYINTFAMNDEKKFIITAMNYFYGSGDADRILTAMKCYPEWL